jgi:thiol-disulfide isomerase/thioredoxin
VKVTEIEKIIAESKTPLIINMWATWCQPCVEEIPYFISEVNRYNSTVGPAGDSLGLLLVSLDFSFSFPDKIAAFAKKRNFTAPIVWLDETNADYFCPKIDAKWSGAIPATLFINNKTGYRKFYEGQLFHPQLKEAIKKMLTNTN